MPYGGESRTMSWTCYDMVLGKDLCLTGSRRVRRSCGIFRVQFQRRLFSASLAGLLAQGLWPAFAKAVVGRPWVHEDQAIRQLARLEAEHGGRLGVAVREVGTWRRLDYRSGQRFPICSTHKVLTVAAILRQVEQGRLQLDQPVRFIASDLLAYAPICRQHLAAGTMSVAQLCAAALQWSDNTAANLLLARVGGPTGWTAYARSLEDFTSRLDRNEPTLNQVDIHGLLDTTTPAAMVADLDAVLFGRALNRDSRQQLLDWLKGAKVTGPLLRAGLPADWQVADKSGAGQGGSRNDIGLLRPPAGKPLLAAVFHTGSVADMPQLNRVIAAVGGIIAAAFAA